MARGQVIDGVRVMTLMIARREPAAKGLLCAGGPGLLHEGDRRLGRVARGFAHPCSALPPAPRDIDAEALKVAQTSRASWDPRRTSSLVDAHRSRTSVLRLWGKRPSGSRGNTRS